MKFLVWCLSIFVLIGIVAAAWIWHEAAFFLNTPPEKNGKEVVFEVSAGVSPGQIAKALYEKGLITNTWKFVWLARLTERDKRIQAGRFALNTGWKPEKILNYLATGKTLLHKITIPEGLTWWQTAKLLDDAGFVRFKDFKEVIESPDFLRHYGIPFSNAEGFLMPDTYFLKKPDFINQDSSTTRPVGGEKSIDEKWKEQARKTAGKMIDNFWRKASELWSEKLSTAQNDEKSEGNNKSSKNIYGKKPKNSDLKNWVILASIVEKETALEHERGRVAGVYANRLKKNILLQADPTVIYGLGSKFIGNLLKRHLEDSSNAYNTYKNNGLPPGPICSFGISALNAAINPEKHEYLFFVAITDGGAHKFSRTLAEHNLAVKEYRQNKVKRGQ